MITINKTINKKIKFYTWIIISFFLIIFVFLFKIMILDGKYYINELNKSTNIIVYGDSSPRGRIYDRNYNLLVDNESVPILYYQKDKTISKNDEILLAYDISKYLDIDYTKNSIRSKKEFWILKNKELANSKITEEEWTKYKRKELNNNDINNLIISRISEKEINSFTEEDFKASYIYYLMNNGYSYSDKVIKEKLTDSEYSFFNENIEKFPGFNTKITWVRKYLYGDTLKNILGNIGSIPKERKEYYLKNGYKINDIVGLSNIEYQYEDILRGEKAKYLKVSSNKLKLISEAKRGNDIVLSIDINLQQDVDNIINNDLIKAKNEANTEYLNKTYAIIQDPNNGEILAISGRELINNKGNYITYDISNNNISDAMVPGSVVKGASMLVGYNTNNLKIGEVMTDECIKIKNIPRKCSSHRVGSLNDITALAESSNVYQFKIAMRVAGFNYKYNENALYDEKAFNIYQKMFNDFGLGVKTGIDLPNEKIGYRGKTKSIDLLLNYAIGQYDTYTPIQLSQYISTIANNGNRLKPHLLKEVYYSSNNKELGNLAYSVVPITLNSINVKNDYLKRVQEGFIAVMDVGLGKNVMGKIPNPAGKTGTSESFLDTNSDGVIDTETISNAFVGYAPYDNPKMTLVVMTPDVRNPSTDIDYHSYVNRRIARNISNIYFEKYY